jgi:hypothetical protein
LLVELIGSTGGNEGLEALASMVQTPTGKFRAEAATVIAVKMDPARAGQVLGDALAQAADPKSREALYRALATVPGEEGVRKVLDTVNDTSLPAEERLLGLKGLWNREIDSSLQGALSRVVKEEQDPGMRVEAMRMLFFSGATEGKTELRDLAVDDRDPRVRAQAVSLAAMQKSEDPRGWLEERLLRDSSMAVKTAALEGIVMHAHMSGKPEKTAEYLSVAKRLARDEKTVRLIERGQALLESYDPRDMDLGLREEARKWSLIAGYTSGQAARQFNLQSQMLERLGKALESGAGR